MMWSRILSTTVACSLVTGVLGQGLLTTVYVYPSSCSLPPETVFPSSFGSSATLSNGATATATGSVMPTSTSDLQDPFVLRVDIDTGAVETGLDKRATSYYIAEDGTLRTDPNQGAMFELKNDRLRTRKGYISTSGLEQYKIFAASAVTESIATTFSISVDISRNQLRWTNATFYGGAARFCSFENRVYIDFYNMLGSACRDLTLGVVDADEVIKPGASSTSRVATTVVSGSTITLTKSHTYSASFSLTTYVTSSRPFPSSNQPGSTTILPGSSSIPSVSTASPSTTGDYPAPTTTGKPTCNDGSGFDGTVNDNFLILCDTELPGTDLVETTTSDFAACIAKCDAFVPVNGVYCIAVEFDTSKPGNECRLKSNIPGTVRRDSNLNIQAAIIVNVPYAPPIVIIGPTTTSDIDLPTSTGTTLDEETTSGAPPVGTSTTPAGTTTNPTGQPPTSTRTPTGQLSSTTRILTGSVNPTSGPPPQASTTTRSSSQSTSRALTSTTSAAQQSPTLSSQSSSRPVSSSTPTVVVSTSTPLVPPTTATQSNVPSTGTPPPPPSSSASSTASSATTPPAPPSLTTSSSSTSTTASPSSTVPPGPIDGDVCPAYNNRVVNLNGDGYNYEILCGTSIDGPGLPENATSVTNLQDCVSQCTLNSVAIPFSCVGVKYTGVGGNGLNCFLLSSITTQTCQPGVQAARLIYAAYSTGRGGSCVTTTSSSSTARTSTSSSGSSAGLTMSPNAPTTTTQAATSLVTTVTSPTGAMSTTSRSGTTTSGALTSSSTGTTTSRGSTTTSTTRPATTPNAATTTSIRSTTTTGVSQYTAKPCPPPNNGTIDGIPDLPLECQPSQSQGPVCYGYAFDFVNDPNQPPAGWRVGGWTDFEIECKTIYVGAQMSETYSPGTANDLNDCLKACDQVNRERGETVPPVCLGVSFIDNATLPSYGNDRASNCFKFARIDSATRGLNASYQSARMFYNGYLTLNTTNSTRPSKNAQLE